MATRMLKSTAGDPRKVIKQSSNTVAAAGYQECGLSGKAGGDATGLATSHTYYLKINHNGTGVTEASITTVATVTFTAIIGLLNTAMTGALAGVVWGLSSGDLRCTSATSGTASSIALSAGTTGDNFFAALTGFTAFDTAVVGVGPAEDPLNDSAIPSTGASTFYPLSGALNTVVQVWGDTNVTGSVTVDIAPSASGPWSVVGTATNPTTAGTAVAVPAGSLAAAHCRVSAGSYTGGPVRATIMSTFPNGNRLW